MSDATITLDSIRDSELNPLTGELLEFEDILCRHPQWSISFCSDDPLYALPKEVIERLSTSFFRQPAKTPEGGRQPQSFGGWSKDLVLAEREFADCCEDYHAVGYQQGRLIGYGVLRYEPLIQDKAFDKSEGVFETLQKMLRLSFDRRKGAAGFLLTHPSYLDEAQELRTAWGNLPESERPVFPLTLIRFPPGTAQLHFESLHQASPETADFGKRLGEFLEKWNLTCLHAWDLPETQGLLAPDLLPEAAPARPTGSVSLSIPTGHHYQSGEMDALVAVLQQNRVRESGVDPRYATLRHHELYATMLDVLHIERAVLSRFPNRRPPHGLISAMIEATAQHLQISHDRVRSLRKIISKCLRGEHASVPELLVKI